MYTALMTKTVTAERTMGCFLKRMTGI
jgi:hypothetical protein